jgi:hypothetical protein
MATPFVAKSVAWATIWTKFVIRSYLGIDYAFLEMNIDLESILRRTIAMHMSAIEINGLLESIEFERPVIVNRRVFVITSKILLKNILTVVVLSD